jgi:hypothetical protein
MGKINWPCETCLVRACCKTPCIEYRNAASTLTDVTSIGDEKYKFIDKYENFYTGPFIGDGILIDRNNKTIKYVGKNDDKISVKELYSKLSDMMDEEEYMDCEMPMLPVTQEMYELNDGWAIDDKSIENLDSGSIRDDQGNIWTNIYSVGNNVDEADINIVQNGKTVASGKGSINALVKTHDKGNIVGDGNIVVMASAGPDYKKSRFDINNAWFGRYASPVYLARDLNYNVEEMFKEEEDNV